MVDDKAQYSYDALTVLHKDQDQRGAAQELEYDARGNIVESLRLVFAIPYMDVTSIEV